MESIADLLQQALRHHQLGELPKAEAIYRVVLQREPDNADALHWLGVVALQSRRADVAVGLLGRAVQRAPGVASYQHNYAEAWMAVGEVDQAILAYRRAVELDPARRQSHAALGIAYRRRGREAEAAVELEEAVRRGEHHPEIVRHLVQALAATGRFAEAQAVAQQATSYGPDAGGEAHRALGESLGLAGRFDEAVDAFRRAAEIRPADPRPHHGLGVAFGRIGKIDEAIASFQEAIRLRPDYPDARRGLAAIFFRTGRLDAAAEQYQAVIRTRPNDLLARRELAALFECQGRPEQAAEQYRHIRAAVPADASVATEASFNLAALGADSTPPVPPPGYVANYFNNYAETFDRHLVEKLSYRAPQLVHDAVVSTAAAAAAGSPASLDVIDLGCGTGLCGPLLKPLARTLVGVDLSSAMLAKARGRNLYDELIEADLVEALRARPGQFDLAVAADVLVYLGDLAPVLSAAACALRQGGRFVFTVEADGDAPGYRLAPSRRYVHGATYLRAAAAQAGLRVALLRPDTLRTEHEKPVNGYVVVLGR